MRYLVFILILGIYSCSGSRGLDDSSDLNLLEAYYKYSVGGKEQTDNAQSSLHYFFLFEENSEVKFTGVEINQLAYDFESFTYEGERYLVVKTSPKSENLDLEKVDKLEQQKAVISYELKQVKKILLVDEIQMKAPTLGN
ncbi:MAG: hypothetical protein H6579_05605 [Chitinophagales bacterium]|nr:hypothetical protein [Bacteroidota bacterium]MCB9256588.1 hypothetical protein [Chitinophagales bacterium]